MPESDSLTFRRAGMTPFYYWFSDRTSLCWPDFLHTREPPALPSNSFNAVMYHRAQRDHVNYDSFLLCL